ncbi:hypothetical protein LWI29_003243 [Acer saccharum]|uniref:Uncharacterized protein n=1 Tax=Acer saccharum TaxID=4024 RepID=A0AA39W1T2_ACESA|nr:hypothetical protein LWI29_003243 [Acer saccharum]
MRGVGQASSSGGEQVRVENDGVPLNTKGSIISSDSVKESRDMSGESGSPVVVDTEVMGYHLRHNEAEKEGGLKINNSFVFGSSSNSTDFLHKDNVDVHGNCVVVGGANMSLGETGCWKYWESYGGTEGE